MRRNYKLIFALILLSTKFIIGQKHDIDTIVFQNAILYTRDTITEENKVQLKNKFLYIVPLADLNENTVFLFNDSIYSILSLSKIEYKFDHKSL